jgi:glutathione synthase
MRIAFLVSDVKAQQPSFGGICLAWAAQRRGHEVCFVSSHDLSFLDDNTVLASTVRVRAGEYHRPADFHAALVSSEAVHEEDALSSFDVIFLRYNPLREPPGKALSPVIDFCWRLRVSGALVVNDPEGVRRAWGRLYLADLPAEVRARTMVSRSPEAIKAFLRELDKPAVLKPLAHAGGEKVFFLPRRQTKNLNSIISAITREGYALAQEYLPEARGGEKRILLLGGAPIRVGDQVAIYRRRPSQHLVGHAPPVRGKPLPRAGLCRFGASEQRVCDLLRPKLLADGLYFVAVDIVGDKILELNVFSPGGIHSLREIYRIDVATVIIRDLERRARLRAAYRGTADPEAASIA